MGPKFPGSIRNLTKTPPEQVEGRGWGLKK
jgi:hypothetical protein